MAESPAQQLFGLPFLTAIFFFSALFFLFLAPVTDSRMSTAEWFLRSEIFLIFSRFI